MQRSRNVAVINAGGWGTALAVMLANQGHAVQLWARREALADEISLARENAAYLPGVAVPGTVRVTADLAAAVAEAEIVVVAVVASYMAEMSRQLKGLLRPEAMVVHGTKGLEPERWRRLSQVLSEALGAGYSDRVAVLAGPNHAEEVARGLPTAAVLACADAPTARQLQQVFNTRVFRVYTNPDVAGVELCSAAKNVIALAAGMSDGLGYGDNSKAALITRALAEMWRLVERHGGSFNTVAGLAGVGDVVATCTSLHSRNRWAGEQIGRGRTVQDILASTPMVIEGIPAARGITAVAQACGVEMPICEAVAQVVFDGKRPDQALSDLMERNPSSEG